MMMAKSPMGAIEAPALDDIIKRMLDGGKRGVKQVQLSEAELRQLCIEAKRVFWSQPNLLEFTPPSRSAMLKPFKIKGKHGGSNTLRPLPKKVPKVGN